MKWPGYLVICHVCVLKCFAMSLNELEDFSNFLRETSQLDQNVKSNIPSDESDEAEPIQDNAWEASGKFEGDLILNERQRRMILMNVAEGLARNGLTDSTKRWPNNEVVYFIQPDHFNSAQVEAIQTGIADLARVSCVKFRPYERGDKDAVVIQGSRRGCFSQVGYQGGYQVLNLSRRHPVGRGCFRHGTVVHELLHTLGFFHMQSSPDRDDYIDVLWENIIKPARHNFRKYNSLAVSDFGVGYDYDSVLHYSRKAFSSNGQDTLIPKKLGAVIGQRIGLSDKDVQKLNIMYCNANPDLLIEDSSDTPKKAVTIMAAESKPFEGHGLGYQQGKLVIIRLPRPEKRQMQDLPQFPVFDYFSKTTQELPPAFVQGVGVRKEVNPNIYDSPDTSDEEYEKFITAAKPQAQYDNKNRRPIISYDGQNRNIEGDTSSENDDLTEDLIRILSDIENTQDNVEENDNSDPRMRLLKESEEKKLNSFLFSPIINDNIKAVNSYVINGPLSADVNQNSEQNNQRESEEEVAFRNQPFQIPDSIRHTGQNLSDNRIWYRKNNIKPKPVNALGNFYPLNEQEQLKYSYLGKEVPKFEKWLDSDQKKHESYTDRNPSTVEYFYR